MIAALSINLSASLSFLDCSPVIPRTIKIKSGMNKIKQMEYERSARNTIYPDSVEILAKNEINKHRSLLSKFFTKPKL